MNDEMDLFKKQLKENIQQLIDIGKLFESKKLVDQYKTIVKNDPEAYSMEAVIFIMEGKFEIAKEILKQGLNIDNTNFDLNYNIAYLYEQTHKFNKALEYYTKAVNYCDDEDFRKQIVDTVNKIKESHPDLVYENRLKLVFFVKQGMDSFLGDIIEGLSNKYETKKIVVTEYNQIDKGMQWADICWFEWCDELVAYGSKHELAKEKKILCRLHRFEALTDYPKNVNWNNIDKLIIVTEHLKKFLVSQLPNIEKLVDIITIYNGVNLDKYELKERKSGFNIAYVGYIHQRKNPVLLLQIISKLVKKDKRYKLYIAGQFQDGLIELYWNYQVQQMELQSNVIFQGWQDNISEWLEDKNYILSTSIHESFGYGIAEAMARGIKPIIHNFVFAEEIWDKKYLFNTIDEAVNMIVDIGYNSNEYRKFIIEKYSLDKQINKVISVIVNLEISIDKSIFKFIYNETEIKFYLPYLNDWVQKVIYETSNFYEFGMLQDIKNRLGENKVVIDIGANIGNHTVFFSKICKAKKVYSFEPQANIFKILKKNIEINEIDNIVELYNMGLGKEHNFANVTVVNENNYGMSRLDKNKQGTIEINSLDNIFINRLTELDMIKIDVEGMELEVLEGAKTLINKFKPLIYIEAGTYEEFVSVSEFFNKLGYKPVYKFNATPTYLFIHLQV